MKKISERTLVLEFLKKHVIGKSVIAPPITTYIDNDLVMVHEEDAVYSNLVESMQGFSFDMTTLTRGTRYLNGKSLVAEGSMNAVRVIRYEMTERLSTGNLVGHARFISSTNTQPDPFAGTIFLVQMRLTDQILDIEESHVGYADLPTAEGTFKPVATDGNYKYVIERDKLAIHYQQTTFDVEPELLKRTRTSDKYPVQISHEINFPNNLEMITS